MQAAENVARALLALREEGAQVALADWQARGIAPATLEDGYAAQDAMTAILTGERGQSPIGYKIGATNAAARGLLGVSEPFFGRLYAEQTYSMPASLPASPVQVVAEPEIAVVLARDLSPDEGPFDAETIRAATAALVPAIEVISGCLDPWTGAGGPTIVADNGAHGVWLPGEAVGDWSAFDPLDSPIAVDVTGAERAMGRGGAVDGGPFGATAWLANALAARGEGMAAGTRISTGTVTPPIPLKPGMTIACDYGALGTISLTIGD